MADKLPIFNQGTISGIFEGGNINGSLWSLGHEFRLYCLIALLGVTGLLRKSIVLAIALISWAAYFYCIYRDPSWDGLASASTYRTTAHFMMGAMFYFFPLNMRHSFAILSLILAAITLKIGVYPLVSPITTAYCIFYLATVIPFYKFGSSHDFSYGVYVYAFPIQKTLTEVSVNKFGVFYYFLISIFLTFLFALFSWFIIEKNAMKLKRIKNLIKRPEMY